MAGVDDVEELEKKNILYDLTVQTDWRLENEPFIRAPREKDPDSTVGRIASGVCRSTTSLLRTIGLPVGAPAASSLPESLVRLVSSQINWHLAVGSDGAVAILQDQSIEIRWARDNYEKPVGRAALAADPFPQWRCVAWSQDSTMVACSRSNGAVDIFDIMGMPITNIPCPVSSDASVPHDLSVAVACLSFTDFSLPGSAKMGSAELLVISYKGLLKRYKIERESLPKLQESFSFASYYPLGISSAVYHSRHRLLYVGGQGPAAADSGAASTATTASGEGITAWRLLSDFPHYKLVSNQGQDEVEVPGRCFLSMARLSQRLSWTPQTIDGVFRLCLSPGGDTLVALHTSGKLSQWELPSLRLRHAVALEDQETLDELPADMVENPQKRKRIKDLVPHFKLVDINFWSEKELILARCTGAVTVVDVERLHNMLGRSPEWFAPSPRITGTQHGGFLVLECETEFPQKRLLDVEDADTEDEDASYIAHMSRMTKDWLYFVTDSERFKPPKKKPKLVNKVYKLLHLKSTTPEELYTRKIDAEEYGEALQLAKSYGLDTDLVYQRRWRRSPVSIASIQDYLSKISKRSWVLHECLERVPENLDAMLELLEYGLRGTDLQALITIGKGEDEGRFILCDPEEGLYEDMDPPDPYDTQAQRERERRRKEYMETQLSQVDFQNLSLEQKELCRARLKLLQYRDRLKTYEYILGGPQVAPRRFDSKFYKEFRSQNLVEAAIQYARAGDSFALEALFTYHGQETLPHRLAILTFFCETLPPEDYKSVLPVMASAEEVSLWEEDSWRDSDWSESPACRDEVDPQTGDPGAFLYEDQPELKQFCCPQELTKQQVQAWYRFRACQMEQLSGLVNHVLELVKIAISKGVEGLLELLDDLLTMELLVYECGVGDSLSLQDLQAMADYDKLELMMSKSTLEMYVKNARRWMVPFLVQCERKQPGAKASLLRDFVLTKAKQDLTHVVKIFQTSKPKVDNPIIPTHEELMSLALEALYTCERDDQLDLAFEIFKCLPQKGFGEESAEMIKLHKEVDMLEYHLGAAQKLQHYGLATTLAYVRDTQNDPVEAEKLMIKLARMLTKKKPPASTGDWQRLHSDVIALQERVYRCLAPKLCLEIFVEALMGAGTLEAVKLSGDFLERSQREAQSKSKPQQLEFARAMEICCKVAREYYNSAANLSDPCMELARACLHLMLDTPEVLQQELDLIGALALLAEFNVNILPVQVRLCEDKLDLVQKAIESKAKAYRQSHKLVRLAHLLRVPAASKQAREGVVLQAVAQAAIQVRDVTFAQECCQTLVEQGYQPAWSVCLALAELPEMTDVQAKLDLLSFAVTYCTPDRMEAILQAKGLLETKVLWDQVTRGIKGHSPDSQEASFSTSTALQQTARILSSTGSATRAVLSTVTDKSWWRGAITSLKQPARRQHSSSRADDDGNAAFQKQGCHPFYEDSVENAYVNMSEVDYRHGESAGLPEAAMTSNVLRTAMLEDCLVSEKQDVSEVLLELAKSYLPRDSSLGLAYLLALPQKTKAEGCFDEFPCTAMSMQLAAYYYALQVYSSLQPNCLPSKSDLYLHDPSRVVERVMQHITSHPEAEWPQEVLELIPKLQHYQELLEDYNQARVLKALHTGIDVIRFAEDGEYRKETILGLAMSVESKTFQMAVTLAQRYALPLWDVYMAHLEFLFSDSGLSTEEVSSQLERLGLLSTLTSQPADFCQRMYTYVYPTISGTDHERLLYFFSLLGSHAEGSLRGVSPDAHVKLLRKIKGTAPELDYKRLMDDACCPIQVLEPVLTSGNVNNLAKLAPKIPAGDGAFLQPSLVYAAWAVRKFWDVEPGKSESAAAWIHRYEACGEFTQKLQPEDMLSFVEDVVFTERARQRVPLSARQEMVKRALKLARQGEAKKKRKEDGEPGQGWDEAAQKLQQELAHLERLGHPTLAQLLQSDDPLSQQYASLYDLSAGLPDRLQELLVRMVWDGQPVEQVQELLEVAPVGDWTTQTAFSQAISRVVDSLRVPDTRGRKAGERKPLEVLQTIVERVQEHAAEGGDQVTAVDVKDLLRPFCSDSAVAVQPRLDVLNILEKSFQLSVDDSQLLLFYRTRALVSSAWPDLKLSEEDVSSEAAREELFQRLLSACNSDQHFLSLARLLQLWPPAPKSGAGRWKAVLSGAVGCGAVQGARLANATLKDVCQGSTPLQPQESQELFEAMLAADQELEALKFALLSGQEELYDAVLHRLAQHSQAYQDEELVRLLLERGLAARAVGSVYYPRAVEVSLEGVADPSLPPQGQPEALSQQLQERGLMAEAGSLLLQARSSHRMLQSFAAALYSVGTWVGAGTGGGEGGEPRRDRPPPQAAKTDARPKSKSKAD